MPLRSGAPTEVRGLEYSSIATPSSNPTGVGFDSNDSIWLADSAADKIYKARQDGTVLDSFSSPSGMPGGIGVDSSGCIWNADESSARLIYKLDQDGNVISSFGPGLIAKGVGVDSDDCIWYADTDTDYNYIRKVDQTGSTIEEFSAPATGSAGLSVDSDDSIWLADYDEDKIYKLDQTGSVISSFTSPSASPYGLGIDSEDFLWNADMDTTKVYKLNQFGDPATAYRKLETDISDRLPEIINVCSAEDISGGVDTYIGNYNRFTLFIHVAGAVDITLEASPDGGSTWYELPESPLSYGSAQDDALEIGYDFNKIRLTGSNATNVTADIRGVF